MKLLYSWFCCLTVTYAATQPPRLDNNSTDPMFYEVDGRGLEQSSTGNNFVLSYKNNSTSRQNKIKKTHLATSNKGFHQRNEKKSLTKTIGYEEKYDENTEQRRKREPFDEAESDVDIKMDLNSYLQTNNLNITKHNSSGLQTLPLPKNKMILSSHKGIFTMYPSPILRNSQPSEHEDNPESIILQILSSKSNKKGNSDDFKNVGLTKTVVYNVTKLQDKNRERSFLIEKKENLTVEMSYLDSQERETKYLNTHTSNLHKILGPNIFDDEWTPEEDIEENNPEENRNRNNILSNNNNSPHDFVGSKQKGNGKSSNSDNTQRGPSEFIGGTFVGSGFTDPINSPQLGKRAQLNKGDENESEELLGQPDGDNQRYLDSVTITPYITVTDFQQLILDSLLRKGYMETSIATPAQGSEEKINFFGNIDHRVSENIPTGEQAGNHGTEEILTFHNPEQNLKSNPIGDNQENTDATKPSSQDKATTSSMFDDKFNPMKDTHSLIVKHGESIVLDPDDNIVTVTSVTSSKSETSSATSDRQNITDPREITIIVNNHEENNLKSDDIETKKISPTLRPPDNNHLMDDQKSSLKHLQSTETIDENKSSDEAKEDDGNSKNTQNILEIDTETEEASTEIQVIKDNTESNVSGGAHTTSNNIFKDTQSTSVIQEVSKDTSKTFTENDQIIRKDPPSTQTERINDSNTVDSNKEVESDEGRNNDEGYNITDGKTLKNTVTNNIKQEDSEDVSIKTTAKDKNLGKEPTTINPEQVDNSPFTDSNETVEKDENKDDGYKATSSKTLTYTPSNNTIEETPEDFKTSPTIGQKLYNESSVFSHEQVDDSNTPKSNETDGSNEIIDGEILQSKPKDNESRNVNPDEPIRENITHINKDHTPVSATGHNIINENSTNSFQESEEGTSEDDDFVTGEFSNIDPNKIKLNERYPAAPQQRGDISLQGSTLDNEIERDDGKTTPHAVELFGGPGQRKGQQVHDKKEVNISKPSSVIDSEIDMEEPTAETLTELCFPLINEKEITLYDLLSGKLYLESEGKKTLLKLKDKPMRRCNSGTRKCKLPVGFEYTNEPVKGTDTWEEDINETDVNYTAKITKRHIIEDENIDNQRTDIEETDHLSAKQHISNKDQKQTTDSRKKDFIKEIFLTDLLLMLETNETSSNSSLHRCSRTSRSDEDVAHPVLKIKNVHQTTDGKKNPKTILTLITLLKKIGEEKNKGDAKAADVSQEWSGKRTKRSLVQEQDLKQEKGGGCECGNMLDFEREPIKGERFKRTIIQQQDDQDKGVECECGNMLELEEEPTSGERFKRTLVQLQDMNHKKGGGCECGSMLDLEREHTGGERLKRTIIQQQDNQDKEVGCGCGSMLGRTLPPIPNYDHFLGKRLNIITSIAHAIKEAALNRPIL